MDCPIEPQLKVVFLNTESPAKTTTDPKDGSNANLKTMKKPLFVTGGDYAPLKLQNEKNGGDSQQVSHTKMQTGSSTLHAMQSSMNKVAAAGTATNMKQKEAQFLESRVIDLLGSEPAA